MTTVDTTREIADRYRARAEAFERKVAAVQADQWENPSPCEEWTARDVVRHMLDMHEVMLRPLDRGLSPAPSVQEDPPGAFRAARADVEAVLADSEIAQTRFEGRMGPTTIEEQIDRVVSDDLVIHGWDLACATGQDDTIDPEDVERLWSGTSAIPPDVFEMLHAPDAFGPGIVVFGPVVQVPEDAPLQDRLLGALGRDRHWQGHESGAKQ